MLTIRETTEIGQATQVYVDDSGQMSLTAEAQVDPNGQRRGLVLPMTLAEVERLKTSLSLAAQMMRRAGVE